MNCVVVIEEIAEGKIILHITLALHFLLVAGSCLTAELSGGTMMAPPKAMYLVQVSEDLPKALCRPPKLIVSAGA